jgi:hypothetical protein
VPGGEKLALLALGREAALIRTQDMANRRLQMKKAQFPAPSSDPKSRPKQVEWELEPLAGPEAS